MKLWVKIVLVVSLSVAPYKLFALQCAKATSKVEITLCNDGKLLQLDTELNSSYRSVRSKIAPNARAAFLKQQQSWLADRNRMCVTGEAACLYKEYKARLDQLQALDATAEASSDPIDDVTSVIVKGAWKASAVFSPGISTQLDEAATVDSLKNANLPLLGTIVTATPGKLCFPEYPCDPMGWRRIPWAKVDAGWSISQAFGLSLKSSVLVGSSGGKWSYYLLLPQSNGNLWSIFGLCGPNATNCRHAAEVWTPASPDAAVLIGTQARSPVR